MGPQMRRNNRRCQPREYEIGANVHIETETVPRSLNPADHSMFFGMADNAGRGVLVKRKRRVLSSLDHRFRGT